MFFRQYTNAKAYLMLATFVGQGCGKPPNKPPAGPSSNQHSDNAGDDVRTTGTDGFPPPIDSTNTGQIVPTPTSQTLFGTPTPTPFPTLPGSAPTPTPTPTLTPSPTPTSQSTAICDFTEN